MAKDFDLAKWVWDSLVMVIHEVASALPAPPAAPAPPAVTETKQETIERWRHDRAHDLLSSARTVNDANKMLESLVLVLTPAQASMLESDEELRFVRISGNNETPLKKFFVRGDSPFGVDEKLCGNELGNFAAFCSARWRANDWMWGRLDAVKSLVDLTMRPERLGRSQLTADEIWRTVQRITAAADMTLSQHQIDTLKMEIDVARLGQPNPDGTKLVRELLTEAGQRQIYAAMRGLIDKLDEGPYYPDNIAMATAVGVDMPCETLNESMKNYNVGSETIRDLNSRRRTQIGMRLALVAHRAFRPLRRWQWMNWIVNRLMTITKPLYLFTTYGALNLARALFVVNMIATGLWVGPWRFGGDKGSAKSLWQFLIYDRRPDLLRPNFDRNPIGSPVALVAFILIAAMSLFSLLLAFSNKRARSERLVQRLKPPAGLWWHISSFAVGVIGLLGSWAYGINLGPVSAAIGGALLAMLASLWMRRWMVVIVGIGVVVLHAAVALAWWLHDRDKWNDEWLGYTRWMSVTALVLSLAFITILSSYSPVLEDERRLTERAERRGRKRLAGQ